MGANSTCPQCGKIREEVSTNNAIPLSHKNIGISLYNGMSMEKKREVLKKRSHEHFKKEVEERKEGLLSKAKAEFREMNRK